MSISQVNSELLFVTHPSVLPAFEFLLTTFGMAPASHEFFNVFVLKLGNAPPCS